MLVQLRETAQSSGGSTPTTSSLIIMPQTLDQYSLLVWKVSYTNPKLALAGKLEDVLCSDLNITMNSSRVIIKREPDIIAVMRSGTQKQISLLVGYPEPSHNHLYLFYNLQVPAEQIFRVVSHLMGD